MPFLLLLFLLLACMPLPWPEPPAILGTGGSLAATAGLMAALVAAAAVRAGRTRRQLIVRPDDREDVLERYGRFRTRHLFALMAGYALALGLLGYGGAVEQLWSATPPDPAAGPSPDDLWPGGELLRLAPFLLAWLASWACFYTAERAAYDTSPARSVGSRPFMSRWAYVTMQARQYLALTGVPVTLIVVEQGLGRLYPAAFNTFAARVGQFAASAVALLVVMPWVLRLFLGLRPLPAGPIRDRLEALAGRLKLRGSAILLWDTRGGVANAMAVGVLPGLRFVTLSDRLLSDLEPAEVEAVFGHEVGHFKHRHVLFYVAFLAGSLMALVGAWAILEREALPGLIPPAWVPTYQEWGAIPAVGLIGAYVFLAFGMLSRRCERQADVFGCRAVSCGLAFCDGHEAETPPAPGGLCPTGVRTFIQALEKVTRLNGVSLRKPGRLQSWLHGSTAARLEFLELMLRDPRLEPRFQRRLGLVKWGLLVALGAVLLGLGATSGWEALLGGM
jgi:STE24 endopeptidase